MPFHREGAGPKAFSLNFTPKLFVAGEVLYGQVDLNVGLALEDKIQRVRVKLRGDVTTRIRVNRGQNHTYHTEKVRLLSSEISLWSSQTDPLTNATPTITQSAPVHLPFHFHLQGPLPPSFVTKTAHSGVVEYYIEVVGDRPGPLRWNRRIHQPFSLVSQASPTEINNQALLAQGWNLGWTSFKLDKHIRRWPWGDYSRVRAELSLPALPSYPVSTPIPFRLHIVTETKPLKRSKFPSSSGTDNDPIFPAPPTAPTGLRLRLYRSVWLRAKGYERRYLEHVAYLGGTGGRSSSAELPGGPHMVAAEPEWIPLPGDKDDKDLGMWRRTVDFTSVTTLKCPPSFTRQTIANQYILHLRIPFPGLTNNLSSDISVKLNSGVGHPPPPFTYGSSSPNVGTNYADVASVYLPPYEEHATIN